MTTSATALPAIDTIDNDLDYWLKDYHRDILWGTGGRRLFGSDRGSCCGPIDVGSPIASVPAIMVVIVVARPIGKDRPARGVSPTLRPRCFAI